jgi:hypothetical protein
MRFSDWLYAHTKQTHSIALQRLRELVERYLTEEISVPEEKVQVALHHDANRTRSAVAPDSPPRQARHLAKSQQPS